MSRNLTYYCILFPKFNFSAPALSSRAVHKSPLQTSSDDTTSRSTYRSFSNGEPQNLEFDDDATFGSATPLLKSFMTQVKFTGVVLTIIQGNFALGSPMKMSLSCVVTMYNIFRKV